MSELECWQGLCALGGTRLAGCLAFIIVPKASHVAAMATSPAQSLREAALCRGHQGRKSAHTFQVWAEPLLHVAVRVQADGERRGEGQMAVRGVPGCQVLDQAAKGQRLAWTRLWAASQIADAAESSGLLLGLACLHTH